jgi:uncharacterized protein (TIGR02444 family)
MRHFTVLPAEMADRADAESLWDFSVRVYACLGVEEACIRLQEVWNADILVLLFALWRGKRGCELSNTDIQEIVDTVTVWQREVITPIRQLRRRLRDADLLAPELTVGMQAVRNELQQIELGAERRELEYLATIEVGTTHKPGVATIRSNLVTYLRFLDVSKADQTASGLLVDAASL